MNKNPNAVALGRMARGHKKLMTQEALDQRRNAAKSRSKAAKARRKNEMKRDKEDWTMGDPRMAGDLIAERDRLRREVQTLVDALTRIAEGAGETLHGYEPADIAKDALAKVK